MGKRDELIAKYADDLKTKCKVTPDMGVVPAYIAVCAGIPPSSVDQIDLSDLNQLAWTIAGFFLAPASPASRN